jgi:hypothetical protein
VKSAKDGVLAAKVFKKLTGDFGPSERGSKSQLNGAGAGQRYHYGPAELAH